MRKIPETVGQNAGLALSRYVRRPKEDAIRPTFFREVAETKADAVYADAFHRWKATLAAGKALTVTGTLGGPLAVGLGNESPYEVGLTLHHTYGMPFIPGTALKGACLRAVSTQGAATKDTAQALFGTTENAGCAIYHDAWFDPSSVAGTPLAVDTVTVHHPDYYQKNGAVFPTDFDDPTPVPFVAVKPGAAFLFAIEIPGADSGWLGFAEEMLRHTLTDIGLGGKTNAGYGWFREVTFVRPPAVVTPEAQFEAVRVDVENLKDISALSQNAERFLDEAPSPELRRCVAQILKERAEKLKKWNKDTADKPWRKAIEEALR